MAYGPMHGRSVIGYVHGMGGGSILDILPLLRRFLELCVPARTQLSHAEAFVNAEALFHWYWWDPSRHKDRVDLKSGVDPPWLSEWRM